MGSKGLADGWGRAAGHVKKRNRISIGFISGAISSLIRFRKRCEIYTKPRRTPFKICKSCDIPSLWLPDTAGNPQNRAQFGVRNIATRDSVHDLNFEVPTASPSSKSRNVHRSTWRNTPGEVNLETGLILALLTGSCIKLPVCIVSCK
jgi:hypothetical protein